MTCFSFMRRDDFRAPSSSCGRSNAWALAFTLLAANFIAATAAALTPPAPLKASDPADATVAVPVVQYESAFARYRLLGEARVTPWRFSNDTVEQRGGWRAYAREAVASDVNGAAAKPPLVPTAAAPPATVVAPVKTTTGGTHVHSKQ